MLSSPGTRIIDADIEAKRLMTADREMQRRLTEAFGKAIATNNGIDFPLLGKCAFSSAKSLQTLNNIVHPKLVKQLHDLVFSTDAPCILDAALIPLWGIDDWFDSCLWIFADPIIREKRILKKATLTSDQVKQRMKTQESIVSAPHGPSWSFLSNDQDADSLRLRLKQIINIEEEKRKLS